MVALLLLSLVAGTLRLSHMLASETGPLNILPLVRHLVGVRYDEHSMPYGTNWVASGILCMECNSVWVGLFFTVLVVVEPLWALVVSLPFALSELALLVHEVKEWILQK